MFWTTWIAATSAMPATVSVSGLLKLGEADAARRAVAKRQSGSAAGDYLLLVALVVVCGAAGAIAWRGPGMAIGVVCAFLIYSAIAQRLALRRLRKRMTETDVPNEIPCEVEIRPEAFSYSAADVQYVAKWPAVTELFPSHGYWIFLVRSAPCFVPKRFFADEVAERAFLKAALEYMSEDARRRSIAARAFAELVQSASQQAVA
jgi:hypothetical protein